MNALRTFVGVLAAFLAVGFCTAEEYKTTTKSVLHPPPFEFVSDEDFRPGPHPPRRGCQPDFSCVANSSLPQLKNLTHQLSRRLEAIRLVNQLPVVHRNRGHELLSKYLHTIKEAPKLSCVLNSTCWEVLRNITRKLSGLETVRVGADVGIGTGTGTDETAARPGRPFYRELMRKARHVVKTIYRALKKAVPTLKL